MKQFILNEVKKMGQVYCITPDRIISDFRKEKREMNGLKVRQLLELLQKAAKNPNREISKLKMAASYL